MRNRFFALVCSLSLAACHGEPKTLEPRSPPTQTRPELPIPQTPVPAGFGRVVLVGTDGRLQITARADTTFVPPGYSVPPNRTGELCTTPCVVDLPAGRYKLYMTSADGTYAQGDSDMVEVKANQLTYYLRAPGKFEQPEWIPILPTAVVTLGVIAILGGSALLSSKDGSNKTAGGILLGSGIAVGIAGGIWSYDRSRGAIQAGATTTWSEPQNPRGNP